MLASAKEAASSQAGSRSEYDEAADLADPFDHTGYVEGEGQEAAGGGAAFDFLIERHVALGGRRPWFLEDGRAKVGPRRG